MRFDRACAAAGARGALRTWICVLSAALAVTLGGCSANTRVTAGTPVTTVGSEATGDFSSYIVGIEVTSLTRNDGFVTTPSYEGAVEEYVDLTKRVNLTELLSAIGITTGTYTSATIAIDYSDATIYLKGQTTAATVTLPTSGTTSYTVTVKFDPSAPLVINQNQSSQLAIDVDLAASDSVDQSTNTVTVKPFLVATAQPADAAPIRARGMFVLVDANAGNFTENIRPFDDSNNGTVGALTVNTSPSTYFDIDGTPYMGSAGLSTMASQSSSSQLNGNSTIVAYGSLGSLSGITPTFNATQVYIGTSVVTPGTMEARGIVSARSGNALTLRGVTYLCQQGASYGYPPITHFESATVDVGSSTAVTEDGTVASGLSSQSISVGQQVHVTGGGNVNCPDATNSTAALTLNATSGEVRLQPTTLWGTLGSGTTGSATLALQQLGVYAPGDFNFSGTGTVGANDANPASYVVDTGTVDESGTASGTLIQAQGLVTPFGSAPPDFTASSVMATSPTSEPATLIVQWGTGSTGTTAPFSSYGTSGLVVNLGNSSIATAIIRTGPQVTQLSSLSASPTILPQCQSACSGSLEFAIGNVTNGVSEFGSASSFLGDLSSTLNGSTAVFKMVAIGTYDSSSNTFYAQRIDVALE